MSWLVKRRPSPAMVVAMIALAVALSGTGYAATKLSKNSVGPKQIKTGAVGSSEVKDRSLRLKDFGTGQIPAGPAGRQGVAGTPGTPGAPGSAVAYARVAPDGTVSGAKSLAFTSRGTNPIKVYCLNFTAGTPTHVQVTVDSSQGDALYAKVAATTDRATLNTFGCSAASDIMISTDSTNGFVRGIDLGFYVAVIA